MGVIDEEGRLFGRVNVIDALVVLLGLAVVAAGLALVAGGGDTPDAEPTRNATLVVENVPAEAAGLVARGPAEFAGDPVTVTDVYRAPGQNGSSVVLATISANGTLTDRGFVVGGTVLRAGASGRLSTSQYAFPTTVRSAGGPGAVPTRQVRVTVTATVGERVADAISTGDAQLVAGEETARVVGVERSDAPGPRRRVAVDVVVRARTGGDVPRYGDAPLRAGASFPFATDEYEFEGTVANVSA